MTVFTLRVFHPSNIITLAIRTIGIVTLGNEQSAAGVSADLVPMVLKFRRVFFVFLAPLAAVALSLSFFRPTAYPDRVRARARVRAGRPQTSSLA
jgi:hypothetical protein